MNVLEVSGLHAGYGPQPVVHGIDLTVAEGEVVALLGANGAGKTTTLMAIAGVLPMLSGQVLIGGEPATEPLYRRARAGLGYVTEDSFRNHYRQMVEGIDAWFKGEAPRKLA